jgi:hypothetical protein
METPLFTFGSIGSPRSAAEVAVTVGELVCVHVTATYHIGARVMQELDPERGILIRETYPLGQVPAGWEPAHFYARPDSVFPAI